MNKHFIWSMIFVLAILVLLAGCTSPAPRHVVDTVEVKVPIVERAEAPKELFRVKLPPTSIPRWLGPKDPAASACVSQPDETKLKGLLLSREALLDGWEGYAAP